MEELCDNIKCCQNSHKSKLYLLENARNTSVIEQITKINLYYDAILSNLESQHLLNLIHVSKNEAIEPDIEIYPYEC